MRTIITSKHENDLEQVDPQKDFDYSRRVTLKKMLVGTGEATSAAGELDIEIRTYNVSGNLLDTFSHHADDVKIPFDSYCLGRFANT